MRILFWNLQKKPLVELLGAMVHDWKPDVVALAEYRMTQGQFIQALDKSGYGPYFEVHNPAATDKKRLSRIRVAARLGRNGLRLVTTDSDGLVAVRVTPAVGPDVLLVVVHLASKNHQRDMSQMLSLPATARVIRKCERLVGHARTVLVGDLNMNPFEPGLVAAEGLHAVMSRAEALRGSRVISSRQYPFFYNPMWSRFGEATPGPAGTYFYSNAEQVCFFWNIFDQVLLRPDLLQAFNDDELWVLNRAGDKSLVTPAGHPNSTVSSDHLPIVFDLHVEAMEPNS